MQKVTMHCIISDKLASFCGYVNNYKAKRPVNKDHGIIVGATDASGSPGKNDTFWKSNSEALNNYFYALQLYI